MGLFNTGTPAGFVEEQARKRLAPGALADVGAAHMRRTLSGDFLPSRPDFSGFGSGVRGGVRPTYDPPATYGSRSHLLPPGLAGMSGGGGMFSQPVHPDAYGIDTIWEEGGGGTALDFGGANGLSGGFGFRERPGDMFGQPVNPLPPQHGGAFAPALPALPPGRNPQFGAPGADFSMDTLLRLSQPTDSRSSPVGPSGPGFTPGSFAEFPGRRFDSGFVSAPPSLDAFASEPAADPMAPYRLMQASGGPTTGAFSQPDLAGAERFINAQLQRSLPQFAKAFSGAGGLDSTTAQRMAQEEAARTAALTWGDERARQLSAAGQNLQAASIGTELENAARERSLRRGLQTQQLGLEQYLRERGLDIQGGDLDLRGAVAQDQSARAQHELALRHAELAQRGDIASEELGLERDALALQRATALGDIDTRRMLGMGDLNLRGGDLALRGELGRGELGVQRGDLDLRGELGRGELGLRGGDLDLRRELGRGELGLKGDALGLEAQVAQGRLYGDERDRQLAALGELPAVAGTDVTERTPYYENTLAELAGGLLGAHALLGGGPLLGGGGAGGGGLLNVGGLPGAVSTGYGWLKNLFSPGSTGTTLNAAGAATDFGGGPITSMTPSVQNAATNYGGGVGGVSPSVSSTPIPNRLPGLEGDLEATNALLAQTPAPIPAPLDSTNLGLDFFGEGDALDGFGGGFGGELEAINTSLLPPGLSGLPAFGPAPAGPVAPLPRPDPSAQAALSRVPLPRPDTFTSILPSGVTLTPNAAAAAYGGGPMIGGAGSAGAGLAAGETGGGFFSNLLGGGSFSNPFTSTNPLVAGGAGLTAFMAAHQLAKAIEGAPGTRNPLTGTPATFGQDLPILDDAGIHSAGPVANGYIHDKDGTLQFSFDPIANYGESGSGVGQPARIQAASGNLKYGTNLLADGRRVFINIFESPTNEIDEIAATLGLPANTAPSSAHAAIQKAATSPNWRYSQSGGGQEDEPSLSDVLLDWERSGKWEDTDP